MTRDDLKFRVALSRFGVALVALALLPVFYPRTREHLWIWGVYLAVAAFEQMLIRRRIGGRTRAVLSGLVDTAVLTYTVHGLGSTVTPMASIFCFAGVANALVSELPVALVVAAFNALAYDAVVVAEWLGAIPFAPDAPQVAVLTPRGDQTVIACVFVTTFVLASTAIVGLLVRAVQQREVQLVEANGRLEDLSQRDPLTDLFNRRHLFKRLELELARTRRGHPLSVVMIDLDHFKGVNDAHGHLHGDALLREIASALAASTRVTDVAGRYGGDEFLVVLPDTEADQARTTAERLRAAVRDSASRFSPARPVTASVGVSVAADRDTVASLLRRADENAYRAKEAGGDRVVVS
jgi:diguanylate cyclase (GGDEF)-like protein